MNTNVADAAPLHICKSMRLSYQSDGLVADLIPHHLFAQEDQSDLHGFIKDEDGIVLANTATGNCSLLPHCAS